MNHLLRLMKIVFKIKHVSTIFLL